MKRNKFFTVSAIYENTIIDNLLLIQYPRVTKFEAGVTEKCKCPKIPDSAILRNRQDLLRVAFRRLKPINCDRTKYIVTITWKCQKKSVKLQRRLKEILRIFHSQWKMIPMRTVQKLEFDNSYLSPRASLSRLRAHVYYFLCQKRKSVKPLFQPAYKLSVREIRELKPYLSAQTLYSTNYDPTETQLRTVIDY